jgi:hypothetical protein
MNEQPHTLHLPRMVEAFEHAAGSVAAATAGLIPLSKFTRPARPPMKSQINANPGDKRFRDQHRGSNSVEPPQNAESPINWLDVQKDCSIFSRVIFGAYIRV